MRWEDERYVRLYTRDTPEFLALSFEAQGLLALIIRKVDRAGILQLGKLGKRGAAVAVGHPHRWEPTIAAALEELLEDGCVVVHGDKLVVRNFVQAQEATMSPRARAASYRDRLRAGLKASTGDDVTPSHETSPPVTSLPTVTERNVALPAVTVRDQNVTPSRTKPSVPTGAGSSADHEAIGADELVEVLHLRFPQIEDPQRAVRAWRKEFPDLDLVAETKAAHLYAESSGKKYDAPGAFLLKWFKSARAAPDRKANGNGEPQDDGRRYVPNAAETKRRLHEVFGPHLPGGKR